MVTTATVTGRYSIPGVGPADGFVEVVTSVGSLLDRAGNVVLAGPAVVPLDAAGAFSAALPVNDDPGLSNTGFGYTLTAHLRHATLRPFSFLLPSSLGPTVDITDLATVEVDAGVAITRGMSAFEVAVAGGYTGTQAQWLASLVGPVGPAGPIGPAGPQGIQGVKGDPGNPTTFELRGTGFPEGVVAAPVGTYYTDTAATNGAIRWVKASGAGATGWKVDYGDTGWRNVLSLTASGVANVTPTQSYLRRAGDTIEYYCDYTTGATAPVSPFPLITLPAGVQPSIDIYALLTAYAATYPVTVYDGATRVVNVYGQGASATARLRGVWTTTQPWPATLPGTAV